ncbi:hypothetical protein [Streptomyces sp. 2A115]|uniref:hypothetical protein n=1 Tax=Streptomyces sp. 2A115 TaxID=3457439 RepID=UPI003FD15056
MKSTCQHRAKATTNWPGRARRSATVLLQAGLSAEQRAVLEAAGAQSQDLDELLPHLVHHGIRRGTGLNQEGRFVDPRQM